MAPQIHQGDCLEVMRSMPDNSVDACVTDPPYGLGQIKNIAGLLTEWMADRDGDDHVGGSGFMGRAWDKSVPGPRMWRELLRVLKPGAYALVFAGSRTSDMMGLSLRLAGFELVDSIFWCFGAGFPKGADVGKMLDKAAGMEREVLGKVVYGDGHIQNSNKPKFQGLYHEYDGLGDRLVTAPATEAAREWDGYRSQLKPAHEPVLVCRKPLEGTIAQNALKWGTGAFNIDACRVGTDWESEPNGDHDRRKIGRSNTFGEFNGLNYSSPSPAGRYPANLILQHAHDCDGSGCGESCPVRIMGEQSGECKSGGGIKNKTGPYTSARTWNVSKTGGSDICSEPSTGTAARYFTQINPDPFCYMGKATKKDRTCDGTATNTHPTVKPRALIKHLVTLIMPPSPDAVVIDPFGGSGTTAVAAKELGRNVILIEREPEYIEIIHARLNATAEPDKPQQPAQLSLL